MKKFVEQLGWLAVIVAAGYLVSDWYAFTEWAGNRINHLLHWLAS